MKPTIYKQVVVAAILLSATTFTGISQTIGRNYVKTQTMLNEEGSKNVTVVQYYDGLGRPDQTVRAGISAAAPDLVTLQECDSFGRPSKTYVPYNTGTCTDGNYVSPSTIKSEVGAQYGNDNYPFAETIYEKSPLNRPETQFGAGQDWRYKGEHPVKTRYLSNASSGTLACRKYVKTLETIKWSSYYNPGDLYVTEVTNEDSCFSYEFKDKLGRVVLTRNTIRPGTDGAGSFGNGLLDTYYIYDDFGNLACVLPPEGSDATIINTTYPFSHDVLKEWAFLYRYDHRRRCSEKKLPGCDWVYYVYDRADRLILTQDGNQRPGNLWTFNKYDAFGRLVLSGEKQLTGSREYWADELENKVVTETYSTSEGFTNFYTHNGGFNHEGHEIRIVNYYDDPSCSFKGLYDTSGKLNYQGNVSGYGTWYSASAKGLLVGTVAKSLSNEASGEVVTAFYYDDRGRIIQRHSINSFLGGTDKEFFSYNFAGDIRARMLKHTSSLCPEITEEYVYSYDDLGRPTKTTHKLDNGSAKTLAEYTYDKQGRTRQVITANGKNTTHYTYNIRGWLKKMSGSKFEEELYYYDSPANAHRAYFCGNLSALRWKDPSTTNNRYKGFIYNDVGFMHNSDYWETSGSSTEMLKHHWYDEHVEYDKNGNVKMVVRSLPNDSRSGYVQEVPYVTSRQGNQLINVQETGLDVTLPDVMEFKNGSTASVKYTYDKNGNLTQDLNKGIRKIAYNSRNLPERIEFTNTKMIHYTYDAAGTKRRVVHQNGSDTPMKQYCENKVYDGTTLTMILHETGYLSKENGTWKYFYYLKDHVGSNRLVLDDQGGVVQINNFYPYGLTQAEPTPRTDQAEQPYKFGGKELDRDFGVDAYDFEARMYNPAIGRFMQPDPLAEKYYSISPYAYCGNNPVNRIDPTGMDWYEDKDGNAMWRGTKSKEYTDDNGTNWKNIGTEYLLFDGSNLYYFQQQENKDGKITGLYAYSYGAVSGRAQEDGTFSYTEENQAQKNTGPIPSGLYSINPQDTQKWNDLSMANKVVSTLGIGGRFQGGTYAWGDERVWINPQSVKVTNPITGEDVQRDNFSIHGGKNPGSAGCIDLHRNAPAFFKRLSQSNSSYIRLNVLYTPYNKSLQIWRKK